MHAAAAQAPDQAAIIRQIDAAVAARVDNVLDFTDVEHYSVYRGGDETHPVAEMTVRDHYKKGVGKDYTVLSQSGSGMILHFGLKPLIDNEKTINLPGNWEKSWFTSANYEMKLKPGGVQKLNGRDCYVLAITPRGEAPNLIIGTLWADAKDGSLVQIDGVASKSPSAFAGTTHMMRQYAQHRRLLHGHACARRVEQHALWPDRGHHRLQQLSVSTSREQIDERIRKLRREPLSDLAHALYGALYRFCAPQHGSLRRTARLGPPHSGTSEIQVNKWDSHTAQ